MAHKFKSEIEIKGARTHNLKNIDVTIPHNQLVVITGLSGSGKSTLAFDTIFAEGQRRYVESLSSYARQFLGRINKPDVDSITGIAPAIAIEQRVSSRNPRSTVGTSTEIYDYLKLLFARVGRTFSPVSGKEVCSYNVSDIVNYIYSNSLNKRTYLAVNLEVNSGVSALESLLIHVKNGIQRVYYNGDLILVEDFISQDISTLNPDNIYIVIDRVKVTEKNEELTSRLFDSTSKAMECGEGKCVVIISGSGQEDDIAKFSSKFELDCITFEQPSEHLFSFNNPIGACPCCDGYGKIVGIDEDLVVPDKSKSIYDDAIACWKGDTMKLWKNQLIINTSKFNFPIHRPFYDLTRAEKQLIWSGNEYFEGLNTFFQMLEKERYKIQYRVMLSRYTGKTICSECGGARLRKEALYVRVGGKNIADLVLLQVDDLMQFFTELSLDQQDMLKSERIILEIKNRLQYLIDVGLGYLTLDRLSSTLSGGESQRINLSTSLGSSLVGSLYILDEPSIGLHPRDTERLIKVLKQLRDLGNTVIVVEHEEEIMRAADQIIDIGPLAGSHGGEVVFNGSLSDLSSAKCSLTADYIMGKRCIERIQPCRKWRNFIELRGVREHNLKGGNVKFPLGVITCVTGVSGSGKSTLVKNILYPAIKRELYESGLKPGSFEGLYGDISELKSIELVDQNPIGKSSRSNPVTYIKAYDDIRKLFTEQPYARNNNMNNSHFSFNIAGGRCEECQGNGFIKVSMQFMADLELTCESCGGKRFKPEVLEVKYNNHNIYDILEMSVDEAIDFFGSTNNATCQRIVNKIKALQQVGLGYIKLGQSSSTLSGGENQRVKLASFLLKENTNGNTIFIFDEPTTGLHFNDVNNLLISLNALIEKGHTVVIVEHNMDVINCADWIIDLGPEAGEKGGAVLFEGTPTDMIQVHNETYTSVHLSKHISNLKQLHL